MRCFWQEFSDRIIRVHANILLDASRHDTAIRQAMLLNKLITVDQALEMSSGISALFQGQSAKLFGIRRVPYLPNILTGLVLGWEGGFYDSFETLIPVQRWIDDLAAFGNYLINYPDPPWIAGPVDIWSRFFWGHPAEHNTEKLHFGLFSYLGAAATLLISAECMQLKEVPQDGPLRSGPLSDLTPYIACRWGNDLPLPELPLPEKFSQTFRDWAHGLASFVVPSTS